MKKIAFFLTALLLSGCATKHYGRQEPLAENQASAMNCLDIDVEDAKVHAFLDNVDKESRFDWRSVLALLNDFGISNVIEQHNAVSSANTRLAALQNERVRKGCSAQAALR